MKNTLTLIPLIICFSLLTGYNFMSAQWSAAPSPAPGNNTPAPINVGPATQAKSGNLMANILAAATSTWSPRYCDALGENCFTATSTGGNVIQNSENGVVEIGDIVMQWGKLNRVMLNQTFHQVTLPQPVSQLYNVNATITRRPTDSYGGVISGTVALVVRNATTTSFEIAGDHDSGSGAIGDVYWFAIGKK